VDVVVVMVDGDRMTHRRLITGAGQGTGRLVKGGDRWTGLHIPLIDACEIDKASRRWSRGGVAHGTGGCNRVVHGAGDGTARGTVKGDEAIDGVKEVVGTRVRGRGGTSSGSTLRRVKVRRWGGASKRKSILVENMLMRWVRRSRYPHPFRSEEYPRKRPWVDRGASLWGSGGEGVRIAGTTKDAEVRTGRGGAEEGK
jgi:hypothetical protein